MDYRLFRVGPETLDGKEYTLTIVFPPTAFWNYLSYVGFLFLVLLEKL